MIEEQIKTAVQAAADAYGVCAYDVIGPSRAADVVDARHCAAYAMRIGLDMSLSEIGAELGGRDHTTALHSVRRVAAAHLRSGLRAERLEHNACTVLAGIWNQTKGSN